jgi:hypothetical protein
MRCTTIEEQAAYLERRKKELGITGDEYVPVNQGGRRTESKKALLRSLKDAAEKQGRKPRFKANI